MSNTTAIAVIVTLMIVVTFLGGICLALYVKLDRRDDDVVATKLGHVGADDDFHPAQAYQPHPARGYRIGYRPGFDYHPRDMGGEDL